jgi:hypothetical protein
MTFQLAFNIFVTVLTFFLWFMWKSDTLLNKLYKMAMFLTWFSGLSLIAMNMGFVIKV